jgi:hypothetical protein
MHVFFPQICPSTLHYYPLSIPNLSIPNISRPSPSYIWNQLVKLYKTRPNLRVYDVLLKNRFISLKENKNFDYLSI